MDENQGVGPSRGGLRFQDVIENDLERDGTEQVRNSVANGREDSEDDSLRVRLEKFAD